MHEILEKKTEDVLIGRKSELDGLSLQDTRELFEEHLSVVGSRSSDASEAGYQWRLSCFDHGAALMRLLLARGCTLTGATIVDPACAWGGHAMAFSSCAAKVHAFDLSDHGFAELNETCRRKKLPLTAAAAACEKLPLENSCADYMIALELIEHIPNVSDFAREAARLLKPGGYLVVSTPARLRAIFDGEPHFGLRFLAALPFALQKEVAARLFKKCYPYPIYRQYSLSSQVVREFRSAGFVGEAIVEGNFWRNTPQFVERFAAKTLWKYFVFRNIQHREPQA